MRNREGLNVLLKVCRETSWTRAAQSSLLSVTATGSCVTACSRLCLWPFPPFSAFHTFPGRCFPALGLHPHPDSEFRCGSVEGSILSSWAQRCSWKWGKGRVNSASSLPTGSKSGALSGVAIASPLLLKSVWSCPVTSHGLTTLPQLKPSDYYLQGELPTLQSITRIQWIKMSFPPWNNSAEACSFPTHWRPHLVCIQGKKHWFLLEMNLFLLPTRKRSLFFLAAELNHHESNFSVKIRGLWIRT